MDAASGANVTRIFVRGVIGSLPRGRPARRTVSEWAANRPCAAVL